MYDIIIRNGKIIDGTGQPMFSGDVAIKEDRIVELGELHNEHADMEIDAQGKYVTPGFIDVNNHSDTYWRIFLTPKLESLIYQGITTIIGGNCGSSLAPLVNRDMIQSIQKWADTGKINLNWLRVGELLDELERKGLPVNFGTLVGHSTLRRGLVGDEVRALSADELEKMKKMLERSLEEGALGLSTGLIYSHAKIATEEEIEALANVVKDYGGIYTTHIRGEARELLGAVAEAMRIAEKTRVKVHISHLKAMGEKNWPLLDEALALIGKARANGGDISFDVYPYTTTGSVLYVLLPDWVAEGGKKIMLSRLKDPSIKAKIIEEMKQETFDYAKISIAISPLDKTLTRKKISDIAAAQGKSVEEVIIELLIASGGRVITAMDVLSEANVTAAIKDPAAIIASNGSGYNLAHQDSREIVHPRNFGAFPRALAKYVRETKTLSWEEAVYKMSGKAAERFGLEKRGTITPKKYADIVILDPATIQDLATSDNPYQYARGIEWVIVNGKVIVKNGRYNGVKAGEIIRR